MDQTRRPYEFGANPFSGSRNISYTKTQTDGAKNRTFRSSLRAVKMPVPVDRQNVTQKHRVKRRIVTEMRRNTNL